MFSASKTAARLAECVPERQFFPKSWSGFTLNNFAVVCNATKATIVFVTSLGRRHRRAQRQIVWLTLRRSLERYPDRFRRVSCRDPETNKGLVFLTNNFDLPALAIAQLYKSRWRVELFFKWLKQNLRIKHFFGTTDNAVKTQVWIAVCVYVLVAIVRKELGLELSLSQLLQVLSVNVFEQMPLAELATKTTPQNKTPRLHNYLSLHMF